MGVGLYPTCKSKFPVLLYGRAWKCVGSATDKPGSQNLQASRAVHRQASKPAPEQVRESPQACQPASSKAAGKPARQPDSQQGSHQASRPVSQPAIQSDSQKVSIPIKSSRPSEPAS